MSINRTIPSQRALRSLRNLREGPTYLITEKPEAQGEALVNNWRHLGALNKCLTLCKFLNFLYLTFLSVK